MSTRKIILSHNLIYTLFSTLITYVIFSPLLGQLNGANPLLENIFILNAFITQLFFLNAILLIILLPFYMIFSLRCFAVVN